MRSLLFLPLPTLFALVPSLALAQEESFDPERSLEDIIAADGVTDEAAQLHAHDDGRWLAYDAMKFGFAHTPVLRLPMQDDVLATQTPWSEQLPKMSLASRARTIEAHQGLAVSTRIAFDIPIADHPLVDTYVDYFTGRGRVFFAKWLERADRYIPMMHPVLEAKGMPKDLVYVAMIESGFSSRAVSSAKACGFWQFMGPTGRMYKLRNDTWVDERRDFIRATEAAANYLRRLHNEFDDWYLAWASYNAGEGKVRRTIAKFGVRDFWQLIEVPKGLAKETRHYVPKIIAAAIVAKDRKRYGFAETSSLAPLTYDEIAVDGALALSAVAKAHNITIESLRELNPALTFDVTPPDRIYQLRVPSGSGAAIASWLSSLPKSERVTFARHQVKRGDTLWKIANVYGTTIVAIREFNSIGNRPLHPGQMLIIPSAKTKAGGPSAPVASREALRSKTHRVGVGDTLWSIAQRYGVSVDELKSRNGRDSAAIGVGEVLTIF